VIVAKFGGTSVADAAAIRRTGEIVRGRLGRAPVIVVSALAGATNALLSAAELAASGQLVAALEHVSQLRDRHLATISELLGSGPEAHELRAETSLMFDELAHLAEALSVLGFATPRSMDAVASMGERLSAPICAAAFSQMGIPSVAVDSRQVMITNDDFGRAAPLPAQIAAASHAQLLPIIAAGKVPVVGGFVGATTSGITTTLGRGGSDYSAALFGAALNADAIEIWTDVDGMLTADPRVVPGAQLIEHLRFDEAAELASFGAKVLHPSTIAPAVERDIPVYVFNSMRPEAVGTRITFEAPPCTVRAIAGKRGVVVVRVGSPKMLGTPGALRSIFEVFDRYRISVDVVATSEVSVSLTVDDDPSLLKAVEDLRGFGEVAIERDRGIVALVGAGLGGSSPSMARALRAVGDERLHMVSLSSTGINLTLIVDDAQVHPVMRLLHHEFFGGASA
jgi:aspartate kinase